MTSFIHESASCLLLLMATVLSIAASAPDAVFERCLKRGVHVGRNELAFRQSRQDALAFVRSVFFGGK